MSNVNGCKIAIPLYLWPGYGRLPCAWETILTSAQENPIVVVNPNSGPDCKPHDLFKDAVQKCQAAGIKVLGYVRTEYSGRSLKIVRKDLQLYKEWYDVDGFFIDEMYHWGGLCYVVLKLPATHKYRNCNYSALCIVDAAQVEYYSLIKAAASKGQAVQPILVLNPGCSSFPEAYLAQGDIFVTFEESADKYAAYQPAPFMSKYPKSKFWHMIHSTTSDKAAQVLQQFQQQHAGWLYLTDLTIDNPYKDLPESSIWQLQLQAA